MRNSKNPRILKRVPSRLSVSSCFIIVCISLVFSSPGNTPRVALSESSVLDQRPGTPQTNSPSKNLRQASETLNKAKELLRHHRPEQALNALNTSLQLFKQTGDPKGEAAVHDALGDLYVFYGQNSLAIGEYQSAQRMFRAANERINADLVLAKLGDLYDLIGQTSESDAAFAQMETGHRNVATMVSVSTIRSSDASRQDQVEALIATTEEQRTFDLVNAARQAQGLNPLMWDRQLALMARDHSENMARSSFLGHVDQNGLDMKGRAAAHGLDGYEELGENIGYCQAEDDPVAFVVEKWMNDHGHRDIVLHEGFTHAGLGIAKTSDGGIFFTQDFATRSSVNLSRNEPKVHNRTETNQDADLYRTFICYANSEFGLGRAAYHAGRLDEANNHFRNILKAADANLPIGKLAQPRRFRAAALTSLGDVAFRQGALPDALHFYTAAANGAREDLRLDLMWAAQRGIGRTQLALAASEKDTFKAAALRDKAVAAYKGACETIGNLLLGSVRSDEARKTFLSSTQTVFDETTSALAEMAFTTSTHSSNSLDGPALTYAAAALQSLEQGRARALLDVLDEARAEITNGISAELLKRRAEIQARQREITQSLGGVRLEGALPLSSVQALEAEFEDLESQNIEVENQIRVSNLRYSTLTRPQPLSVREIQQGVLDDHTVLLEYSLDAENSYLWVITQSGLMLFRLPARSIVEGKVVEFRSKLLPSDLRRSILSTDEVVSQASRGLFMSQSQRAPVAVDAYLAASYDLYKVVLEPAAPFIRDKQLLIVADGALHFIPFEALVTNSDGESYATLSYLIKSNEVIYAPSASVLAGLRRHADETALRTSILLVADPVFDADDPRVKQLATAGTPQPTYPKTNLRLASSLENIAGSGNGVFRLARLKGTRTEAEQIAKLSLSNNSAATMFDLEASETKLEKQDLSKYNILHFATHGLMNPERPQFTGLALSLVGDEDNDGFLLVDEVFNLRLSRPFVMLSACETGLGKLKRGEGVTGLTRAFMYAGATTVGVSLWSVSDEATAVLMPGFYQRLLSPEKPSISAALRGAQLEMIAGGRNSAPFYWAPFVLVGDWH